MAVMQQQQTRTPGTSPVLGAGEPYETLLEHAPDALLVIEQGQRSYRIVNAAAERLLNFTRAELLTLGPDDVRDPAEAPRLAAVRAHIAAHGWWHGEWGLRRKDGSVVQTEATVVQVVVNGRNLVQGLFRDRSDVVSGRWLEAAVLRAHDVQHELNNHLALTTGYAELLADNPHLPADLQDAARDALSGGLGAVEAGKRLIACFTRSDRPDHAPSGLPSGKAKENVLPMPISLSAHRRPP
jgi:PAS domain S-box-containing protein